jgi:hypothetical protein
MMRRLRSAAELRFDGCESRIRKPAARPRHWHALGAAALMGAALTLLPLSAKGEEAKGKAQAAPASRPAAISFEQARKDPMLRQVYLHGRADALKNECVARIVYDPKNQAALGECMRNEECRKALRRLRKRKIPRIWARILAREKDSTIASVFIDQSKMGKRERANIYVTPLAFKAYGEKDLSRIISAHEGTHACDRFYGIRSGGRIFAGKDLRRIDPFFLDMVIEVRANGEAIRKIPESDLGKAMFAGELGNFISLIEHLRSSLKYGIIYMDMGHPLTTGAPALLGDLMKRTIEEYKDVWERARKSVEKF